jgi:3-hydroxyacyl-[acyl-carrier-protein] dehydratase
MELTGLLPHRPPMLLLDRVDNVEPGRCLTGQLTVRADRPWCADGLPPYLVLESWLQSAAVLVGWGRSEGDPIVLVGGLRDVLLGRTASAGEIVTHRVDMVKSAAGVAMCAGTASAGAQSILRVGQVTISFGQEYR